MTPLVQLPLRAAQPLVRRLDQQTRRDRIVLTIGLLAAALGIELQGVQPMHQRRLLIATSVQADTQAQRQAAAAADQEQQRQQAAVRAELARQAETLDRLGLQASSRATLASFLERGHLAAPVRLVALNDLPVQPLTLSAADAADGAASAAAPGPAPASLYRHRVELQLEGPLTAVTQAVDGLEHQVRPLRIEQVRLTGHGDSVQATIVLTLVNQEPTWLML